MLSEELLKRGFQYRKDKLWEILDADQIFGIHFSDGQEGYCHVMGKSGDFNALSIYVGEEAFQRLYDVPGIAELDKADEDTHAGGPDMDIVADMRLQDCIRLEVVDEEEMEAEEENEPGLTGQEEEYARAHRISMNIELPYFYPFHLRPQRVDGPLSGKDEMYLLEALEACHAIKRKYKDGSLVNQDFLRLDHFQGGLTAALYKNGRSWEVDGFRIPPRKAPSYAEPALPDEVLAGRIRMALARQKKDSTAECKVFMHTAPVMEEGHLLFPWGALLFHEQKQQISAMPVSMALDEKALDDFGQSMVNMKLVPQEIRVDDDRTLHFLRHLAEKTGIHLVKVDFLPTVRSIIQNMEKQMKAAEEEPDEALEQLEKTLLSLPDAQIRAMPAHAREGLHQLYRAGQLPNRLATRLADIFGW